MRILKLKSLLYWMPSIIWMCVVFTLSSRQSINLSEEPMINFILFKTLHVIEYTILYVLNVIALKKNASRHALLYASYITVIYALTDELHQMAVPTREGIFRDVLIDSLGIFVGTGLVNYLNVDTFRE